MQTIPLQPVPSQTFNIDLGGQICQIDLFQTATGMYLNLAVAGAPIIAGVICQNLNPIVRSSYLGFIGDLAFSDSQGTDDPYYTGLGSRFTLMYLEAADIAVFEL